MNFESKYISGVKPYKLSSHRAWETRNNEVLKLDWNEATIPPSPLVISKLKESFSEQHLNWYPDVSNKSLLFKIAAYAKVDTTEVQYFPGSDTIHEYIIRAYIEPGDKLIIASPTYDNFRSVAESGGAILSYFKSDDEFQLDLNLLQDFIDKISPKIVYIVNPNNPTGTYSNINDLKKIILNNSNTMFVVDEAYYEFCGYSLSDLVSTNENLLITRTFSKAFALASFRIGYIISNKINIQIMNKVRNAKNISLFAQIAAEAALDSYDYTQQYVTEVISAREFFYQKILKFKDFVVFKSNGNFIFVKVLSVETKYEIIRYLENANIYIRDYSHVVGFENYFRISIGTIDQMEYVYNVLNEYFNIKNNIK